MRDYLGPTLPLGCLLGPTGETATHSGQVVGMLSGPGRLSASRLAWYGCVPAPFHVYSFQIRPASLSPSMVLTEMASHGRSIPSRL
ncbi:hypothetical protein BR93DRAFT_489296 [Coniochaeta sp. PMI_546]|nr:hypothetical protein BR93DRAFT_489296 [Coniochaeta sp. PMI_546]